jgi:two-component system, NtrC family, sensor histidine kinase HydH
MRNLTTRLVIFLMLALMIITGVNDYRRLLGERERLAGQSEEDVRIFAETFALAVSRNVRWGRTTAELKELLDDILARPGLVAVAIYDPEGRVVADNVSAGMAPVAADEVVRDTLKTKEAALDLVGVQATPVVRYVQPFRWPGGRTAAIEVRQTLEGTEAVFHRAVRDSILSRLVVLGLFVLSIVAVTRWNIARPIRALMAGARAVGRGDLAQRIQMRRRDEIGQLAEEFNRMAANLQEAHDQLVQQAEERLRLEREVQQAQKLAAVGMLAAEVAHEIGTPLNVIAGRAEGLGRVVDPGHPERRGLDVIVEQTQRISKIIRTLLDYSRPRRLTIRNGEILPILRRVADLIEERSRRRGVRIELDLPGALPQILADPDQLQQIFLNLMLNALDASPQGERIRVAVGPDPILPEDGRVGIVRGTIEGAALAIHVLDAGKGMTAEQIDHVFEPFFSTKEQGQGTGLGLPIVEQIIRAHRGEIEVLSIPGQGTEVIVRLRLAAEAQIPDSPWAEPAQEATTH